MAVVAVVVVVVADAVEAKMTSKYVPQVLQMQWHITEKCNLRCTHCYQSSYTEENSTIEGLEHILKQYVQTLDIMSMMSGRNVPGHIVLTGGEPLYHKQFYALLDKFASYKGRFSFSILTNGTMIDEQTAEKIASYNPSYVQISIEGTKRTHDSIRGEGNYDKSMSALEHLSRLGVKTVASFTAHKKNYHEFSDVVQACDSKGVWRVWSDRLIPSGSGEQMIDMMLDQNETKEFFSIMRSCKESLYSTSSKTHVAMHRALQFLEGGADYHCSAGNSLITIDANGDLYPCRRMPVNAGNVFESHMIDIYYSAPIMNELRNPDNCDSRCKSCEFSEKCGNGLRCLSYATTKNPFSKDPGCWL